VLDEYRKVISTDFKDLGMDVSFSRLQKLYDSAVKEYPNNPVNVHIFPTSKYSLSAKIEVKENDDQVRQRLYGAVESLTEIERGPGLATLLREYGSEKKKPWWRL
jgi:hypothetical protein